MAGPRSWRGAIGAIWLILAAASPLGAEPAEPRTPTGLRLLSPCAGNCALAIYGGPFVENSMADVLFKSPELPFTWDYNRADRLLAVAFSRYAGTLIGRIDIEPELGLGQRFGRQSETEVWAALYARYRGFPWDHAVITTVAASVGFNLASGVSAVEDERAGEDAGSRLLHYFAPEVTFALPSRPELELMFRFHHRSGAFGLVSDARGGAHYGTVGLRWRF